jgi:ribosomal-protein-alanine N-acetyltransferase
MEHTQPTLSEDEDAEILQKIADLSLDPDAEPVLVPFTAADVKIWKEFIAYKQKIKSWDTWREADWSKYHPEHIQGIFKTSPILETPRLRLRLLCDSDSEGVFRVLSNETTMKYYGTAPHKDIEYTRKQYVDLMISRYKYRDAISFVITFKDDDEYIGHVNANSFDRGFRFVEIAYVVDPIHQRKGIGTEAVGRVVRFLQEEVKIHKIRAGIYVKNLASKKLLEKLGFKEEGYLRDNESVDGKYMDEFAMALIMEEKKE